MAAELLTDEMIAELRREINAVVDRLEKGVGGAEMLTMMEHGLQKALQGLGSSLLAEWVEQERPAVEAAGRDCPECGVSQRNVAPAPLTVRTAFGDLRVRRRRYQCKACRRSSYPLDDHFGWKPHAMTSVVQEWTCLLSQGMTYELTAEVLERIVGLDVSRETVRAVSVRNGERLLAHRDEEVERLLAGEEPERESPLTPTVVIGADGCIVAESAEGVGKRRCDKDAPRAAKGGERAGSSRPPRERGMEAKVGLVSWLECGVEGEGDLVESTYVTTFENAERFADLLYQEAVSRGALAAERAVVLGDGAPWIWQRVASLFERRVEILDWYHVREHVEETSQVLHPRDAAARESWRDEQLRRVWIGEVDAVIETLREEQKERRSASGEPTAASESLRRLEGYLTANRERMDYPRYRQLGYPVGSGAVESACGAVVADRLKCSGMQWRRHSAAPLLHLRAEHRSGRWDEAWEYLRHIA